MTPQELKNSILQLAIQGRLVEQRPEDGTGEDLYKQIQAEKARLIKEGKIKKEKPLPPISEDEIPFEIPNNWKWVKVGAVFTLINGDRGKNYPSKSALKKIGDIPFISALNLNGKDVSVDDNLLFLSDMQYEKLRSGKLETNDLVVCIRGSLGKCGRFQLEKGAIASSLVILRMSQYREQMNSFFFMYLGCSFFYNEIKRFDNGTAQPNLSAESLKNFLFPLPPLAEQKRIVAKIEELLPLVEQYEKAYNRLKQLNKQFPDDMKKSILQLAIQGKLVEQRPEEGTGEELYKQMQAEKARLIKEGKIKKEKPLPPISEDEIPFDIPEKWKWVRLGEIGSWASGATPSRSNSVYYSGDIPWLKTGDLNDGLIRETPEHVSKRALSETSLRLNPIGSVLIAMYGATIGKLGILEIEATTNQACCACIGFSGVFNKYLFYFLLSHRRFFISMAEGGAQPNISKEKIVNTIFPLPPLAEQKRIVAKIEELLPLCDLMKDK